MAPLQASESKRIAARRRFAAPFCGEPKTSGAAQCEAHVRRRAMLCRIPRRALQCFPFRRQSMQSARDPRYSREADEEFREGHLPPQSRVVLPADMEAFLGSTRSRLAIKLTNAKRRRPVWWHACGVEGVL